MCAKVGSSALHPPPSRPRAARLRDGDRKHGEQVPRLGRKQFAQLAAAMAKVVEDRMVAVKK